MLTRIKRAIQKGFYPDKCLACGLLFHVGEQSESYSFTQEYSQHTPIQTIYQKELAQLFCPSCIEDFSEIKVPFCLRCGKSFKSASSDNHVCGDCIQYDKPYQRVRSAGQFNGSLMKAIHQFKYAGKIQFSKPLGRVLFCAFLNYFSDIAIDLIIPIPLHPSKLRNRGFNQAMLMLAEWPAFSSQTHFSFPFIDFNGRIIKRNKKTQSQTGLDREKRQSNIKGAFSILQPEIVRGKQVLLVDDVYTTGATIGECAKELKKFDAGAIYVLTLARATSF